MQNIYKMSVKAENLEKAQKELQIVGAQYEIEQIGENYLFTIYMSEEQEKLVAQRANKKFGEFLGGIAKGAGTAGKICLRLGFGLARVATVATVVSTCAITNVIASEASKTIDSLKDSDEVAEATSNLKKLFFRRKS